MAMQPGSWILLATLVLGGCGGEGSSEDELQRYAEREGLYLQTTAYIDTMPRIVLPGEPPAACTPFIVLVSVRSKSGRVASDLRLGQIAVGNETRTFWHGSISSDATAVVDKTVSAGDAIAAYPEFPVAPDTWREVVLVGRASDCRSDQLPIGENVIVSVELRRNGESATLSTQTTIAVVS